MSFRKIHRPQKRFHYDYSALKTDKVLQSKYSVEVRNRFSCQIEEEDGATESYGKLVGAIEAANNSLLPKKTRLIPLVIDPSSDPLVDSARSGLLLAKDR